MCAGVSMYLPNERMGTGEQKKIRVNGYKGCKKRKRQRADSTHTHTPMVNGRIETKLNVYPRFAAYRYEKRV